MSASDTVPYFAVMSFRQNDILGWYQYFTLQGISYKLVNGDSWVGNVYMSTVSTGFPLKIFSLSIGHYYDL